MSTDRWMGKEEMVHIYSETWLSHKKEQNNAICSNMNGPRNYHTKWTKSENDKQIPYINMLSSVQFSCLVISDSLTPWTAAHQASLSIANSWSLLKLMFIESVMPSSHLILCRPLLLLPSVFPSIRVFSNVSQSLANPWTVAHQAPLSMGFSRQENWSELPCPPPGGLSDPGINPTMSWISGIADRLFTTELPGKSDITHMWNLKYDTKELICKTEAGSQA